MEIDLDELAKELKEMSKREPTPEEIERVRVAWAKLDKEDAERYEKEEQEYRSNWKKRQEILNRPFDM